MTSRDLYNKIQEDINGLKDQYTLLKVLRSARLKILVVV